MFVKCSACEPQRFQWQRGLKRAFLLRGMRCCSAHIASAEPGRHGPAAGVRAPVHWAGPDEQ